MKRDEFLTTFGIGLAAVCTGCLTSCGKGDENVLPGSTTNFTLDLNTDIRNVSDSKVISGVIVVRLAATNAPASFTAVQVACTHEQFPIEYSPNLGRFKCLLHGSEFSSSGVVQPGSLAKTNLKVYNIAISGSTMTVTG